jgi:hypothetical protein
MVNPMLKYALQGDNPSYYEEQLTDEEIQKALTKERHRLSELSARRTSPLTYKQRMKLEEVANRLESTPSFEELQRPMTKVRQRLTPAALERRKALMLDSMQRAERVNALLGES